jgi:acetolactate synthase I/II/III large subunit
VIELPQDVLEMEASPLSARVHGVARAEPSRCAVEQVANLVREAERPALLVGECRTAEFRKDLLALSERWNLPVAATNKMQDQFPNDHWLWIGQLGFFTSPAHVELFEQADLFVAVGTRLGDLSSLGFRFPRQSCVVASFPEILARFASRVARARRVDRSRGENPRGCARMAEQRIASADVLGHAVAAIAKCFPADGIVTTDSGNFARSVHRIFRLKPSECFDPPRGAMGSGVPSALSGALRYPDRQVIAVCGEGGFLNDRE